MNARGLAAREAAELDPLINWWHPVAWAHEVTDTTHATVLLGRGLVLWRDREGVVRCFRDLCVHRGTALSLGSITDGELVCAYHGWAYAGDGKCTRIPQLPQGVAVPAGARVQAFRCEERSGLIWVCLGEPTAEIPDFPQWHDPAFRHVPCPAYTWQTSAPRMLENFTDPGHLAWLHDGLLGVKSEGVVPEHRVTTIGHTLTYELTMLVPSTDDTGYDVTGLGSGDENSGVAPMTNSYVLTLPHAILLRSTYPSTGRSRVLFFAVQPRSATVSTGYCYQSRDFDLEGEDQAYVDFQETLAEQDRVVVESQRPEELPLDIADELHLRFDRVAVAYRRALTDHGLVSAFEA